MSIAILPMADQFSWSPATVGLVQSSFFWGYLLTQVPDPPPDPPLDSRPGPGRSLPAVGRLRAGSWRTWWAGRTFWALG